jgi:hypothetical protein
MLPPAPVCCTRSNSTTAFLYASTARSSLFWAVDRSRWNCTTWKLVDMPTLNLLFSASSCCCARSRAGLCGLHALAVFCTWIAALLTSLVTSRSIWRSCTSI